MFLVVCRISALFPPNKSGRRRRRQKAAAAAATVLIKQKQKGKNTQSRQNEEDMGKIKTQNKTRMQTHKNNTHKHW